MERLELIKKLAEANKPKETESNVFDIFALDVLENQESVNVEELDLELEAA